MKSIYAVYSRSTQGHCDCLLLCKADSCSSAVQRAINETNIVDLFDENAICAECLDLECKSDNYFKIFANDVYFNN